MNGALRKWYVWCGVLFAWRMWIAVQLNQLGPHDDALIGQRFTGLLVALANLFLGVPAFAVLSSSPRPGCRTLLIRGALALAAALVVAVVPGVFTGTTRPDAVRRQLPRLEPARAAYVSYVQAHGKPPRDMSELGDVPRVVIRGCTELDIGFASLWSFCQHGYGTDEILSTRREPDWEAGPVVELAPGWYYHHSVMVP